MVKPKLLQEEVRVWVFQPVYSWIPLLSSTESESPHFIFQRWYSHLFHPPTLRVSFQGVEWDSPDSRRLLCKRQACPQSVEGQSLPVRLRLPTALPGPQGWPWPWALPYQTVRRDLSPLLKPSRVLKSTQEVLCLKQGNICWDKSLQV